MTAQVLCELDCANIDVSWWCELFQVVGRLMSF